MMIQSIKAIKVSLKALAIFTVMTGAVYPLLVTCITQFLFPVQANGSLKTYLGKVIGSELIAQKFSGLEYFHGRPSASEYATLPSGASNLSPTSAVLEHAVSERRKSLGNGAPYDLLTTSASGLDPHITPLAAKFQTTRISQARSLNSEESRDLQELVDQFTESPQFGFLGMARVNVLALNLQIARQFTKKIP